jgi:hypothetical protein
MITVRQPGTVTAASPSYADVKAAVDSAVSGDTVKVPAGSATWTDRLIITKGIYLFGAGIGNTNITSNYTSSNPLVSYEPATPALNEPFRLSGFSFDFALKCGGLRLLNQSITAINKIRIDHNSFSNAMYGSGGWIFQLWGTIYGVADNNIFTNCNGICFYGNNEESWTYLTFTPGTADNFYFEDNTVSTCDYGVYSGVGGRWCVRHNTFTYTGVNMQWPWADAHGNAANNSVMGIEMYENTENVSGTQAVNILQLRGGIGICFNNRVNTTGSVVQTVTEEYFDSDTPPASSPISGQPQHVSSSYFWGNTKNGTTIIQTGIDNQLNYGGSIGLVPRANIDFWEYNASFNGSSGVGVGPLSARPATCTKGVGYWATDTKTLYRATATNVWTAYYTPYTYPHPLRTDVNYYFFLR